MSTKEDGLLDVLIVGAGISGIGAAFYLQRELPHKRYQILESRQTSGGTWDLFRYPGIRSDSDLHTFGYAFKPWINDKAIADAGSILDYLRETARENKIDEHISYGRKVHSANWCSTQRCWEVEVENLSDGSREIMRSRWLFSAAGYYRYDQGYMPEFEGVEQFKGQLLHPQHWPEDLDYRNKQIVVIGSGATAVTLVPAMTDKAAHVTMLQRTPTYVMSVPEKDPIANGLKKILPSKLAYRLTRRKNIAMQRMIWKFCQRFPKMARRLIRFMNKMALPKGYPVDEHFSPPYNPWDQRLCAVPDGDLFKRISEGSASVVTDHIDTFTENGLRLKSGRELNADIVVAATGLNVQLFGGIKFSKDGEAVDLSQTVAFKGMMLSGLPNFAFAVGYTNSSWTLKIGLLCEHFCRMLRYMDEREFEVCAAELPSPNMETRPLLDFGAGYIQRVMKDLPRAGQSAPWQMSMNYYEDEKTLLKGPVVDQNLRFSRAVSPSNVASTKHQDTAVSA